MTAVAYPAPPAFEERGLGRSPRNPGSAGHRALPRPSPSYRWEVPPAQTPARLNMAGRPALAWASGRARLGARGPAPAGQNPAAAEAAGTARTPHTARTTRTAEETHP